MGEIPAELWRYEEDLRQYAQYLCRHHEDAEDIAHNALLKAAQHSEGFRGESSMRTWLHTILTNECRMLRRRKTSLSLDRYLEDRVTQDAPPDDRGGNMPDPAQLAEEAELRHHALTALSQMPDHYRIALFLQVGLGKSTEEIAQTIHKSLPATRTILYRARAVMRDQMGPYLKREGSDRADSA
jgi:RNA polymerase sigma-70 factor, ECF subfamily